MIGDGGNSQHQEAGNQQVRLEMGQGIECELKNTDIAHRPGGQLGRLGPFDGLDAIPPLPAATMT